MVVQRLGVDQINKAANVAHYYVVPIHGPINCSGVIIEDDWGGENLLIGVEVPHSEDEVPSASYCHLLSWRHSNSPNFAVIVGFHNAPNIAKVFSETSIYLRPLCGNDERVVSYI